MRLRFALPVVMSWMLVACPASGYGLAVPGLDPGPAVVEVRAQAYQLANRAIGIGWALRDGRLGLDTVTNRITGRSVELGGGDLFQVVLAGGQVLRSSDFEVMGEIHSAPLIASPQAPILSRRRQGQSLHARLYSRDGKLEVEWRALLRDGGNAIRQEMTFSLLRREAGARFRDGVEPDPTGESVELEAIVLVDMPGAGAQVIGEVPGSPVARQDLFFACEHPDAQSTVGARARCSLAIRGPLQLGQPVTLASVIGAVPKGQLRRGFLYYVEDERAHPYRPFLHYNAWYDICWADRKIREAECLEAVQFFGRELIEKRGVPLASFVWDDGWDDPRTLWQPVRENFPHGFTNVLERAQAYGSSLGFWLSPFGGYGQSKADRLAMGQAQGFETGPEGFSLAGSNYYRRFLETCLGFVERDGANFFKFDGLSRSLSETKAMLRLTWALRARKPDLFISITTGTWPSPFWLWYGDSTWRGGGDMGFHGSGSKREQWITYRDMETYRRVVQAAPLYPLNSLMTQGFAHAHHGSAAEVGRNDAEIRRELRSFFASGTCLQELYVSPDRMSAANWDDLAECARWASRNADVLVDTHWVGGDPGKGEVYGWASWAPRLGILALRNPAATPASITLNIGEALELPSAPAGPFVLTSPWKDEASADRTELRPGGPHTFQLEPFAVRVFEVPSATGSLGN